MIKLIILIAAALLVALGLRQMRGAEEFVANAGKSPGVVESLDLQTYHHSLTRGKVRQAFVPVVKFTASDGREYRFKSDMAGDNPQFQVGDSVEVIYDRANPGNAKINVPVSVYGASYGLIGLGVLVLIIGFVILR